jgi:uncharacterized protein YutE (UPF0331/DUF86 family)
MVERQIDMDRLNAALREELNDLERFAATITRILERDEQSG